MVEVSTCRYGMWQEENVVRSFTKKWYTTALEMANIAPPISCVCVGNKSDLAGATVLKSRVQEWCSQKEMQHYDVSAKDGKNVELAFLELAAKTIDFYTQQDPNRWDNPPKIEPVTIPERSSYPQCTIL
eukprot:Phypoly_transcript_21922.p1 GENE.Phypoly_transcript_21922~~Phypoly_transcript_21922.p1  ORF type:complete len:129 (+),score=19.03 Phypoly_transcript_21922:197-583(+)